MYSKLLCSGLSLFSPACNVSQHAIHRCSVHGPMAKPALGGCQGQASAGCTCLAPELLCLVPETLLRISHRMSPDRPPAWTLATAIQEKLQCQDSRVPGMTVTHGISPSAVHSDPGLCLVQLAHCSFKILDICGIHALPPTKPFLQDLRVMASTVSLRIWL